ncbi:MAG: phosphotransferase [Saprospiraceae bacterium]|nr:phosphotransferase [Saprospiraceae bacterium]
MTHAFPVSSSILSAVALAQYLQEQYPFGRSVEGRLLRSGINDSYLIQDGQAKYVFRVYSLHWRTRLEIQEEMRLLRCLQEAGLSVSYPVPDKYQALIQTLLAPEGERYGVLFSFAEGEKLHNYPAAVHHTIGQLMARMHQITEGMLLERVTYTPELLLVQSLERVAAFLSADSEEMQYLKALQGHLLRLLGGLDLATLRVGAVHLDIWFDNLNVCPDGSVTLFDFDFCGNGWLALDIGYYMLQLYQTEREEPACSTKLAAFFGGYESICPISSEERELLPALGLCLYFFYLGIQCQRFDNWSNSFLSESYLKRFVQALVKRYAGIHGIEAAAEQ